MHHARHTNERALGVGHHRPRERVEHHQRGETLSSLHALEKPRAFARIRRPMSGDSGTATPAVAPGGTELLSRIVISLVACSLVTWQLAETANFQPDGAWLEHKRRLGGTPLQWYLSESLLISAPSPQT
jgi:hypothetical protein